MCCFLSMSLRVLAFLHQFCLLSGTALPKDKLESEVAGTQGEQEGR